MPWPNESRNHRPVAGGRYLLADLLRGADPPPRPCRSPMRRHAALPRRARHHRALRPPPAEPLRRRHRPAHALVPHQPRMDQKGDPAQRPLRLQQSLVAAVEREADDLLRDDAARAAGARHLADPAQGLQAQRRPAADAAALCPLLRPRRGRPEDRLSAVHEALRRRRLGRRQQDRQRGGAVARLRAQRHADHEPAGRRRALRLFRALHRPWAADPLRQLRSGRAAAQPLPARHRLPRRGGPLGARGHDAHDQRLLRLGLQLLRGAAQGRHLVSDRLRQCLPGFSQVTSLHCIFPG